MLYIMDTYYQSIVKDYNTGKLTPMSYSLQMYWNSVRDDVRHLANN